MKKKYVKQFISYGHVHLRSDVNQTFYWISVAEYQNCLVNLSTAFYIEFQ